MRFGGGDLFDALPLFRVGTPYDLGRRDNPRGRNGSLRREQRQQSGKDELCGCSSHPFRVSHTRLLLAGVVLVLQFLHDALDFGHEIRKRFLAYLHAPVHELRHLLEE